MSVLGLRPYLLSSHMAVSTVPTELIKPDSEHQLLQDLAFWVLLDVVSSGL
jgi:hypothetical protein